MAQLVQVWREEPDYAHGFLVFPIAAYILWLRRDAFPEDACTPAWGGLVLVAASIPIRIAAAVYYAAPLEGWSLVVGLGGLIWLLGGLRVLHWSLPGLLFLLFMVPLPYRAERWLNGPLQDLSTGISCFALQTLGRPAFAEGNTLFLGALPMEVEESCSGLRIFVGVLALAYVFGVGTKRDAWDCLFVLLCAAPIALLANAARVVATAIAYESASNEVARRLAHDICGWVTIPAAAVLFALALLSWSLIMQRTVVADVGDLIVELRRERHAC